MLRLENAVACMVDGLLPEGPLKPKERLEQMKKMAHMGGSYITEIIHSCSLPVTK